MTYWRWRCRLAQRPLTIRSQGRGVSRTAELQRLLLNLEEEMRLLAEELRFEEAARLRDQIMRISEELLTQ